MPHFTLEPGHWCWHNDYGEGEVLACLPGNKLVVRFQRWDFPDGSVIESRIKSVAANSAALTPYDGGERNLPTAPWLLSDEDRANLVLIPRGEWICCRFQGHGIVVESCSANWQVVYVDIKGILRERPAWEKSESLCPPALPVCWVAMPDTADITQQPPPDISILAKFIKASREWLGIVEDCEEGFLEHREYVTHLIDCRETIEDAVRANPGLTGHPVWPKVIAADGSFQQKDSALMPVWAARYPHWWQQIGWSIFARVNREYDASEQGIAEHEKQALVRGAQATRPHKNTVHSANDNISHVENASPAHAHAEKAAGRQASGD